MKTDFDPAQAAHDPQFILSSGALLRGDCGPPGFAPRDTADPLILAGQGLAALIAR